MPALNTIFSVSRVGDWTNTSDTFIGHFKADSFLQIGEWLLLNHTSSSSTFRIKEINAIDITQMDVRFASSMVKTSSDNFTINKIDYKHNELEIERKNSKLY